MPSRQGDSSDGNPDRLLCAPADLYVLWDQDCLVHLSNKHCRSNIRQHFGNLPTVGTKRNKHGNLAAKLYSPPPWFSCATRSGPTTFGSRRHYHFEVATAPRRLNHGLARPFGYDTFSLNFWNIAVLALAAAIETAQIVVLIGIAAAAS